MALTTVRSTGISSLPAISGANLTSLNASNIASGTLAAARFTGGKILQVQSARFTGSNTSVTTNSLSATEVTDQITPSATGSTILVMVNVSLAQYENSGSGVKYQAAVYRQIAGGGYSKIYAGQSNAYGGNADSNGGSAERSHSTPTSLTFVDSPSTTSAVDYKLYIGLNTSSGQGNNVTTGASDMERAITLLEIGA
jgi:hypothetical protein